MNKKIALVTGASRGIGRAIAHSLAESGYHLYLVCRQSESLLTDLANELENRYSISCQTFVGDLQDESFVQKIFSQISHLDVLINNAGISYIGLLSDMSTSDWHQVINTNLTSIFFTCKLAVPKMLQVHQGKIINISSIWGAQGASMEVAYSASKGGMNAFTKALAKELAPSNIQVNAISCGVIDTEMNACFSPEELDCIKNEIPADRFGTPKDVALTVLSIINAGSYLTGQIIGVDGGYS